MTDFIRETPRSDMIGAIADALRYGKDKLNSPGKIWGIGAGDLLMGGAPEMMDNASYGQSPFSHGSGMTTKMDPGLLDAALLPGMGTATSLLRKGGSALATQAAPAAVDMSRRAALKGIGALGAGTVLAPSLAEHAVSALNKPGVVGAAASHIAPEAASSIVKAAGTKITPELFLAHMPSELIDGLHVLEPSQVSKEIMDHMNKNFKNAEEMSNYMNWQQHWDAGHETEAGGNFLKKHVTQKEAEDALKVHEPGVVPEKWASQGVTPTDMTYHASPYSTEGGPNQLLGPIDDLRDMVYKLLD